MELDILVSHGCILCGERLVRLQGEWIFIRGGRLKTTCKRRGVQLFVPYMIWSAVSFALSGDYTVGNLSAIVLYPDRYFWFLWVLFWVCVSFNVARFIAWEVRIDELWTVSIFGMIMLLCMVVFDIRILGFQFLAYYFIFYVLGYCMRRFEFFRFSNKIVLILLFVSWFLLAWFWNIHKLPDWFPDKLPLPTAIIQYAYRGLTAFLAVIVILSVAPKRLDGTNRLNLYISNIGVYSLGIYVCHLCFMGSLHKGIGALFPSFPIWLGIIVLFIISLVTTVLVVDVLKRNRVTAKYFLGK